MVTELGLTFYSLYDLDLASPNKMSVFAYLILIKKEKKGGDVGKGRGTLGQMTSDQKFGLLTKLHAKIQALYLRNSLAVSPRQI